MSKKKRMEILTELPRWENGNNKGKINWKQTIDMAIEVRHKDYGNISFKVVDYKNNYLTLDYEGYILEGGIYIGSFLEGGLGNVINITNSSRNTFNLDNDNILHIYGENKNGKWEALYSGNHVGKVMNSTWYASKDKIVTSSYDFNGKPKLLHHVDIKPRKHMVIDHIGNEFNLVDKFYDNRIENLREVSPAENNRNKKCTNEWGYTGLKKHGKGWCSAFYYNRINICTKTKYNFDEAILDNLITQKYLGYKHNDEEFCKLEELSEERVKEVTELLTKKIKTADDKIHEIKEYKYDIEYKDDYYILKKNGYEMLFDCDLEFIKNKFICSDIKNNGVYWKLEYIENNQKMQNRFHRDILGLKPNEYIEYKIHVDHLNNNPSDNRFENLAITTTYSNSCNKVGVGYCQRESGDYRVQYMYRYKFWELIGEAKTPIFKIEQEAIAEVERRKAIIDNARVKLKSKQELDELIEYCVDNNYLQENGLADLDLGYLYWKGILKAEEVA